jgi:cell fate regulator YaaT (PSP1 superfamily)
MGKIIGIRFRELGKIYHFDAGDFVLQLGDRVIVNTEQGLGLGVVVSPPKELTEEYAEGFKKVERLATEDDLWQHEKNVAREKFAFEFCMERIKSRQMAMKLVSTEVLFDGSKIIFYYTADGRVDFRALVKDLVAKFRTRIEMRQIGVRHESKMLGGLGCCGREFCCSSFLNEFAPVSVKMAKEQNLSLNPTKISGVCGRLMCCLTYEYQVYLRMKKGLPKLGKRFLTEKGEGKVIRQNVMERTSTVLLTDGSELEIQHGDPPDFEPYPEPETNDEPDEINGDDPTVDQLEEHME